MFAWVLSAILVAMPPPAPETGKALQSSFVWIASAPTGTQTYAVFRKTFECAETPAAGTLHLFADSRYILWINGRYVLRGPCRFDPQAPEFDSVSIAEYLLKGRNSIAVLVHHYHDGRATDDPTPLNGRTMRHAPGLAARLEWTDGTGANRAVLATDTTWRATTRTRFKPSEISWGSIPDNIDARLDSGDWTQVSFDDSNWDAATSVDGNLWGNLAPRVIPLLRETELEPPRVIKQTGVDDGTPRPLASVLPLHLTTGQEIILDAGQMTVAYDVIEIDAEEGAGLEIRHGGGFRNGNLDEVYAPNQYVAKAGRQTYLSGDVQGFRYLAIRVTSGRVDVHSIKVVQRLYPFDRIGRFSCNDPALNELWTRSVRTVQLCSEDGYEDCTARERTEWMGDAALSEYPTTRVALATRDADGSVRYGDPRLIRNMLRHIAQSQQPDGRLKAHHPSNRWDIHGYIEDYACLWVQTLRAYYDQTGDRVLARELWPNLVRQLQWFLEHRTANGLVKAREFVFFDNPLSYKECEGATLNAYLFGTLNDAAYLADALGESEPARQYRGAANDLQRDFNQQLWDASKNSYHGGIMNDAKTETTAFAAMTALHYGIVPQDRRESVLQYLVANRKQVGTPFTHYFVFDALYRAQSPDMDRLALDVMRERWAPTLARKDLDTVFEGFDGGALCHNMGATPAYALSAWTLGVRCERPAADNEIRIEPHLGDLASAEGVVVTPFGPVPVSWTKNEDSQELKFRFEVPAGAHAIVSLPALCEKPEVVVDGKLLSAREASVENGRVIWPCGTGEHSGQVRAGRH